MNSKCQQTLIKLNEFFIVAKVGPKNKLELTLLKVLSFYYDRANSNWHSKPP